MAGKRLNLGCGKTHLEGFINIDINPDFKPDLVLDFINDPLPYGNQEIDEIAISHVIEHIPKKFHLGLFRECFRILKYEVGSLFLAYPEFTVCAKNYMENRNGNREYWEATLYGRQTTQWDFHVALMDTEAYTIPILESLGFGMINWEPQDGFNTILRAFRVYEEPPTLESKFVLQERL